MRKAAYVSVAFLVWGAAAAWGQGVTGTWVIQGPITPICTLQQEAGVLSGACRGPGAQGPVTGLVDGQNVRFSFTRTGRGGQTLPPVDFAGTYNGETLAGDLTIGTNRGRFTAARAPNAAPVTLASASSPALVGAKPPVAQMPTPQQPTTAANDSPPRSVFDIDVDRSAVHQQSQLVCPATVAGFSRVGLTAFEQGGFDVGCSYRNAAGALVSLYAYRATGRGSFDQDFDAARRALPLTYVGATPRGETAVNLPGAGWQAAGFALPNGTLADLYLSPVADWRLKFRVTYVAAQSTAIAAVMTELSGLAAKTAGAHLQACAAAPAPQRVGQRNRDLAALQALAAAAAADVTDAIIRPKTQALWCAEASFTVGDNRHFLTWRNAAAQNSGAVDRITPMGEGPSVFVLRVPSDIVATTMKSLAPGASVDVGNVYSVVVDGAADASIIAVFSGRPSLQDVAPLAMAERFPVYATVPRQPGGRIQIYKPY